MCMLFADVKTYMEALKSVLAYFKVKKVEQLFRINDSPKYLRRLYDQFVQKQKSIERCHRSQDNWRAKLKELTVEEADLSAKLKLIITRTKELQKHVCSFFILF